MDGATWALIIGFALLVFGILVIAWEINEQMTDGFAAFVGGLMIFIGIITFVARYDAIVDHKKYIKAVAEQKAMLSEQTICPRCHFDGSLLAESKWDDVFVDVTCPRCKKTWILAYPDMKK